MMEALLLAGMLLATLICVAGTVALALECSRGRMFEPFLSRLYWRVVYAVLAAGFAALCLSVLKALAG